MKEDFLHHIWLNKRFDFSNLKTSDNQILQIVDFGRYLQMAGPDIFNAQLIIDNQKWAGNVEIHVKSSDWYLHNHENDTNYDNVILHVVWEHDAEVYRKDNSEIPVLELKNYVAKSELDKYNALTTSKSWIFCENDIATIDDLTFINWKERLFFERLERKAIPIQELLKETSNDWEFVLFVMLAKNFGLNVNGISFFEMAKSIPSNVLKKEVFDVENLEALFFGRANLLEEEKQDNYYKNLQIRWSFLKQKYELKNHYITPIQFFKLRPDNFPTIRLAQLAQLYHLNHSLFSKIVNAKSLIELYDIFKNATSIYWKTHYNFDKQSSSKPKNLSSAFIDLLIINTIIPIKFLYANENGKDSTEELLELISQIKPERNTIIDKFEVFKIKSKSAFDSQALLQLKNEYCNHKKCLHCNIGLALLKN
ncbi:DUF2851 family protein [Flavobacterium ponti]|uniref:DUF2851 family protein n=1 Tax=Flavobacterium ponti TaxID=665133 RepID=A0ABV9P3F0_9FLAO